MRKLLFAVLLFVSCAVMAGMPAANCPADRPLSDWNGNCYSCDKDEDLYSVNGPCEEVCPNRMYMSMPLLVPDWAGCVLDTPSNRIISFTNKYAASLLFAFIPLFIMMLSLLGISIRWTYERVRSKILTFILWFFVINGAIMIGGVAIIPMSLVFVYCFCLCYNLWDICQAFREIWSKDKKVREKAIKALIVLGIYGTLCGLLAIVTPLVAMMFFNLLVPIYTARLFAKKEKQRREKK